MSEAALLEVLAAFGQARVLVLGDVMLDRFVYGSVERTSPEAPVPVMMQERTSAVPGGAANVARNAVALGAEVGLIGVVGDDTAAAELREHLNAAQRLQAHLVVDAGRPTTTKTRYIADRQQMLRADVELAAPLTEPIAQALLAQFTALLAATDIVILSDYGKGALSDSVTARAIAAATAAGKRVLVDPKSRSFLKYRGATVLTPNQHELQSACGHECGTDAQVEAAARGILAQGICSIVVATRGKQGMSIVESGGRAVHIRTVASEVYDVTGAGDTAVAAMAVSLASGADISQAARLANLAAGIVVGKYGTATARPEEILARLSTTEDGAATEISHTLERAQLLVAGWRRLGLRVAFTNGCFDMLHPGHVSLLNQARHAADRLIVGLNSDASVQRLKGAGRPVQNAGARALVLSSLRAVDAVVIFEEDSPLALIGALEPDVLVKGADYTLETVVGADLVLRRGGKVVLAELVPTYSTSETIRRIATGRKA
jgi:D-beta-D-heptose 7-phosphate kinase / D-beta-D-heptose 1-phosphate adenosyltransferase